MYLPNQEAGQKSQVGTGDLWVRSILRNTGDLPPLPNTILDTTWQKIFSLALFQSMLSLVSNSHSKLCWTPTARIFWESEISADVLTLVWIVYSLLICFVLFFRSASQHPFLSHHPEIVARFLEDICQVGGHRHGGQELLMAHTFLVIN